MLKVKKTRVGKSVPVRGIKPALKKQSDGAISIDAQEWRALLAMIEKKKAQMRHCSKQHAA